MVQDLEVKHHQSKYLIDLAGAWAYWGWKGGVMFATEADSSAILTMMKCDYMLASTDGGAK